MQAHLLTVFEKHSKSLKKSTWIKLLKNRLEEIENL